MLLILPEQAAKIYSDPIFLSADGVAAANRLWGRSGVSVYTGASKMVMVAEMTTDTSSFTGARIAFGGLLRGADEEPHYLIEIERPDGTVFFGDYRKAWLKNGDDFNVEIGSFGYIEPRDTGALDRRRKFSPADSAAIEQLIRTFFSNPEVFKTPFNPPGNFLGGLTFRRNWIVEEIGSE